MLRLTLRVCVALLSFLIGLSAARLLNVASIESPLQPAPFVRQEFIPAPVPTNEAARREILDIIRRYDVAQTQHDAAFFRSVEAESFTLITDDRTLTREQDIADMLKWPKDIEYKSDDLSVQFYGDNAAVVTGRMTATSHEREGEDGTGWRWVDLFVKRNGRWQIVNTVEVY